MQDFNPVVRNVQNNDFYMYLGENKFRNIRTGKEGVVADELAQQIFKMNIEATTLINEYPEIKGMISQLNLKCDK
jgi:hypothetical protein